VKLIYGITKNYDYCLYGPVIKLTKVRNILYIYIYIYIDTLGRPRRRWEDNIKMDLQEVGGGREHRMELAQDGSG
jgi:hypothetical protein